MAIFGIRFFFSLNSSFLKRQQKSPTSFDGDFFQILCPSHIVLNFICTTLLFHEHLLKLIFLFQAVSLLDDLDKELNNYIMRAREWYGWHFPELGKVITDNIAYIRTVQVMGTRENCKSTDLSDILPEDVEAKVKEAAEISMGTEISDIDMFNIRHLCDQVLKNMIIFW